MVETDVIEGHVGALLIGNAQGVQRAVDEPDGGVADADDALAEHGTHRLGDDAGRVGEVDDPGLGGEVPHRAGELHGHRDRAEGVGVAAHADRLLAEDASGQGHALVDDPALGAADTDRGEDEVGADDGLAQVRRRGDDGGLRVVEVGEHGAHDLETAARGVVQAQLVDDESRVGAGAGARLGEDLGDLRDAEPAASGDEELHASTTSVSVPARVSSGAVEGSTVVMTA